MFKLIDRFVDYLADLFFPDPQVQCPFCQQWLVEDEKQVINHLKTVHDGINANHLNSTLRKFFPKTSYAFYSPRHPLEKPYHSPGNYIQIHRHKNSRMTIEVDENGLVQNIAKPAEDDNSLSDEYFDVCPICEQTVKDITGHFMENHHLVLLKNGYFMCIRCLKSLEIYEIGRHNCTDVKPAPIAPSSVPITEFQQIVQDTNNQSKPSKTTQKRKQGDTSAQ